jgi:hypothetical protein
MKTQSKTGAIVGLTLVFVLMLAPLFLQAVDFVPGSGRDVSSGFQLQRDREFYYHTFKDDQHWYGTEKWAVRFDFAAEYPTYTHSAFDINRVRIFFPIVPEQENPVTVEIYSDENNLPAELQASVTADISSNWMEFIIPEIDSLSVAWVVLNCQTTGAGPYVSASRGGGTHSYYWNTNTPVEYFQNLYSAGIYSEFLFSVVGRFLLSDTDIELANFELMPVVELGAEVSPQFTIINNSDQTVQNAVLSLLMTGADPDFVVQDTIYISRMIQPYSELVVYHDDPDYESYLYQLPGYPTQIKVRATLSSEYSEADTTFNNSIVRYYNLFERFLPLRLVETFLRYSESQDILFAQDASVYGNLTNLNYFPVVSDSHYAIGATQRYNWYGLMGLPMTMFGGDSLIAGFIPSSYGQLYNGAAEGLTNQKTFLRQQNFSLNLPSPFNYLTVRLALNNEATFVFDNGIDPTLIKGSRFFAALCRKVDLQGRERYVFHRWGAYGDTISTAIPYGASWSKQFNVPVSNISAAELASDFDLLYWIQHNSTKEIIFANLIPLSSVVSGVDNTAPQVPLHLTLAPNPLFRNTDLNIAFNKEINTELEYRIYNCKGQLVTQGRNRIERGAGSLATDALPTSGLYLLQVRPVGKVVSPDLKPLSAKFIFCR